MKAQPFLVALLEVNKVQKCNIKKFFFKVQK